MIWALALRARWEKAQQSLAEVEQKFTSYRADALTEQLRLKQEVSKKVEAVEAESARERKAVQAESLAERERLKREVSKRLSQVDAELLLERKKAKAEAEQARAYFEEEFRKALATYEPLLRFQGLANAEQETKQALDEALKLASLLKQQADTFSTASKARSAIELQEASHKLKELRAEADSILGKATHDARRILDEAHKSAERVAGNAYIALREKDSLEQAVRAIRNVIEGYGDRYVVPTRSLLDELSSDFGHLEAGVKLKSARDQSRRMVEEGHAAECDYAEAKRKETAIRFVIDAFNGRVDGILSRTRSDNHGTLEQEIRDAFALVNLNGEAFRNARILEAYLSARLEELKWAVTAQELRLREREEQRRIQEQIREEEKARREAERVMKEAQKEEEVLAKALEKARAEVESASAEERARIQQKVDELNRRLAEAEAKNVRAKSMAEQTRSGNVYIISNVGSFGDGILKIGMTRRLDPMDRVYELGDASVPFEFDVHAMITADDAPSLERELHKHFEDRRLNRVNLRKEFFRVSVLELRDLVAAKGLQASFTMAAEAREYRESLAMAQRGAVGAVGGPTAEMR
ncbi:GIY-YIG nuclease family protein [Archangium primigenium]|uniref:GIY-YIG nuclease family protein n=1 Tax=[Archangium] primigenium TaxID=2792470 RepID=UPI00195B1FB4|nr:GIY-YIG nuclease family protein [Archangium primigenium]MBM7114819.1 DUF4041 domain-containing protein [Archangium primigenium]